MTAETKPSVEAVAKAIHEADPDVGCTWEQWVAYAEVHPTLLQGVEFTRRQARAVCALPTPEQPEQDWAVVSDPAIWRNAIGNTIALVDTVRRRHPVPIGSKLYATFDAALNDLLEKWFSFSRGSAPRTYEEAEAEWKRFVALTATSPAPQKDASHG